MSDKNKLGDTGYTYGKEDRKDGPRTWWDGPTKGHETTTREGDTITHYVHSPNDAPAYGWRHNTSTGESSKFGNSPHEVPPSGRRNS